MLVGGLGGLGLLSGSLGGTLGLDPSASFPSSLEERLLLFFFQAASLFLRADASLILGAETGSFSFAKPVALLLGAKADLLLVTGSLLKLLGAGPGFFGRAELRFPSVKLFLLGGLSGLCGAAPGFVLKALLVGFPEPGGCLFF